MIRRGKGILVMQFLVHLRSRSGFLAVAAMGAGIAAGASALGRAPRASECDARDSCDTRDDILGSVVMFRHGARTV